MKILITLLIVYIISIFYIKVSFRRKMNYTIKKNDQVNTSEIIAGAKKLKGVLYDPLRGRWGNIGGKLGFIVCTDVPRLAYLQAGYDLKKDMAADYKKHPNTYTQGNTPNSKFFDRRVKNIYTFAKNTNRLISLENVPKSGDVVFYKNGSDLLNHIAFITSVEDKNNYTVIESAPQTIFAKELSNQEVEERYTPVAFGRLLCV